MPGLFDFLPLLAKQAVGSQRLARTPEPSQMTEDTENVVQYNQVMCTKLAIAYAAGLDVVHRARPTDGNGSVIDLACGPGHFTICLAKYLEYARVTGIDLSTPMVKTATQNSCRADLSNSLTFQIGDVTDLSILDSGAFALSSFTDAAHHMPDLETVTRVLREMDRVTSPDGLVMVMDLARLRTEKLTEKYVNTLGHDYKERGLPQFFDDFHNSMYAAWTVAELRTAVPRDTQRHWCHIVPRGLPTIQFLLGLPVGRKSPFVRPGFALRKHPLIREWFPKWEQQVGKRWARETLGEYRMMRMTLKFGSRNRISPKIDAASLQPALTD